MIFVSYHVVISGPLEFIPTAPHIDGYMGLVVDNEGNIEFSFYCAGYPWADAYSHDGKGNVETIFTDPAARADPFDLYTIEAMTLWKRMSKNIMRSMDEERTTPIVSQQSGRGGGYEPVTPYDRNRPLMY